LPVTTRPPPPTRRPPQAKRCPAGTNQPPPSATTRVAWASGGAQSFYAALSADSKLWPLLADRLEDNGKGQPNYKLALSLQRHIPVDYLAEAILKWVGTNLERGRIASWIAGIPADTPSSVSATLLERFPRDDRIEASIDAKLFSGSAVGSLATFFEGRRAIVEQLSKCSRPALADWARRTLPMAEERIKEARRHDEAIDLD
jgi:hypothetical protein